MDQRDLIRAKVPRITTQWTRTSSQWPRIDPELQRIDSRLQRIAPRLQRIASLSDLIRAKVLADRPTANADVLRVLADHAPAPGDQVPELADRANVSLIARGSGLGNPSQQGRG